VEDEEPLDEILDLLKPDRSRLGSIKPVPFRREDTKVGRNDPCPCGSGKKYKYCCLNKV
ncbi:MAG: SEC-C domain-containing protein, partial [Nitrospinae bacterium]|nr:SEC-C domain-containing protein [Nitrospinota bacterium]